MSRSEIRRDNPGALLNATVLRARFLSDLEFIKTRLEYDASTGDFRWLASDDARQVIGSIAGGVARGRYIAIVVKKNRFLAHRLAWTFCHNRLPDGVVDHINGNGRDNRIENLREVSVRVNIENRKKRNRNNKLGLLGVSLDPSRVKPYRASITVMRRHTHLGYFDTPEAASQAYLAAKRRLHEGCTL